MIRYRGTHPDQPTIGRIEQRKSGWFIWPEESFGVARWSTYQGPYKSFKIAKNMWWRQFGKGWTWERV